MHSTLSEMFEKGQDSLMAIKVFEAELIEEERKRQGAHSRAIRSVAASTSNKYETVKSAAWRYRRLRKFVRGAALSTRDAAEIERRMSGMRPDVKAKLSLLPPVALLDILQRNGIDRTSGPTWLVDAVTRDDWDPDYWETYVAEWPARGLN